MPDPRRVLASLLLALGSACHSVPWNARAVPSCPGDLVRTEAIEGDFLLRQQLRVTSGDRTVGMELALQKRGDVLVLVGLHPLGAKLFTVRQTGTDVDVEALPAQVLEIPPENVLRDLHRVYFLALSPPDRDGTIRGMHGETRIREHWEAGRLRERSFGADAGAADTVRVVFSAEATEAGALISVEHVDCGYRAEFRTLSRQSLP